MTYETIVIAAAKTAKVSSGLLLAICMHETGLKNTTVPFDGGSPTFGICQVKLPTAELMGFKGTAKDLLIPEINAKYAALYLKFQMDRYNGDWCKVTAAYNAGRYNESMIYPGYPRNLKYVLKVKNKLAKNLKPHLSCSREVARK